MIAVDWEKTNVQELNITATELSSEALISILTRLPQLRWLSAGYLEHFNDQVYSFSSPPREPSRHFQVMDAWLQSGAYTSVQSIDLNTCDALSDASLCDFVNRTGDSIVGFALGGHHKLLEHFWMTVIPQLVNVK